MKILFVYYALEGTPFNSSIAALSAWMKRYGHQTELLVLREGFSHREFSKTLHESNPDVVAFSYMTCVAEFVHKLIQETRNILPQVRMISGGPHPTTYPNDALAQAVDAICVGEGEEGLRLWSEDPQHPHPGILRKNSEDTLQRWFVPNPSDLPDWDRALFGDCSNSGNRFEEAVGISFSRGFCPFSCSFCGIDGYRRVNQQPLQGAVRLRSPEAVIAELLRIPDTVPVGKGYAAWDEVFPMQRKWVHRFAELYQEQIPHPLACQLRVEQITPDLVEQLQKARCNYAVIGVECGDENYRAKFLNKPFTNEKTIQAFQRLHDTGIETVASFMIGLPFETPKMLAKTIRLAQELQASELSWKYYTPERGTKLIELCQEHDLLIDKYIDSPFGGGEPMIKLVHCTPTDIRNATQALELLREGKPRGTFEQQHATPQKQRPLLEYRK